MRLIDADALLDRIPNLYERREVARWVDEAPTIKPERKPGKWIIHGEPPWYVVECSECGEKWHHWSGYKLLNYCGNCGADMRGDSDAN